MPVKRTRKQNGRGLKKKIALGATATMGALATAIPLIASAVLHHKLGQYQKSLGRHYQTL